MIPAGSRLFRRAGAAMLLSAALLSPACAPKWGLRTAQPDIVLQWPYQPSRAKVTYLRSLTGFAEQKGSGSFFKAVVYGKKKESPNTFILPVAVATGSDGRIAVADLGRRCVHLYLPARQLYLKLDGSKQEKIVSPVGVTFDEELRLYLTDSAGKVFAFGPDGAILFTIAKAGEEPLRRPTGIAYSPRRKLLYVVDTLANRIHAFRTTGEPAFSFGQRGEKAGSFNFPTHLFWSSGELYLTDSLDFRIAIFDEDGKPLGTFGHHGDGSGDLAMPKGIAVDRDGVVFVVDSLFDNVQLFTRRGDFLLTLGRRGVEFGEFWLPTGAFISESNELYVCDTYNRRVQVFRLTEHYEQGLS